MLKTKGEKTLLPIEQLIEWDKNPKSIQDSDFEALQKKIEKYGQFKPLIVNSGEHWGDAGLILGGNMRYKAYLAKGIKEVWVSIVSPKDEQEALEISLIDNEMSGSYDQDKLAELLMPYRGNVDVSLIRLSLGHTVGVESLLANYGPTPGGDGKAPEKDEDLGLGQNMNPYIKQITIFLENEEYARRFDLLLKMRLDRKDIVNNTDAFIFLQDFYENHKDLAKEQENENDKS